MSGTVTSQRPELLLVPGAFHGAWVWDEICPLLRADGWRVRTIDLPSSSCDNPDVGMYDDAATLRRSLGRSGPPTTIVAHSYGGIPATQAAAGLGHVVKIVFVAALLLNKGESLLGALHWQPPPWWVIEDAKLRASNPVEILYGDMDPEAAARYAMRLRPINMTAVLEPLTENSLDQIETSYIVCENDPSFPPDRQEHMGTRAHEVHRLPGGHSPMLARPAEFASLLDRVAWRQGEDEEDS